MNKIFRSVLNYMILFILPFIFQCSTPKVLKKDNLQTAKPALMVKNNSPVMISRSTFNPSQAETVLFKVKCSSNVMLSLNIIDEDGFVIRHLFKDTSIKSSDTCQFAWDGRDDSSIVVPDEAYFPLIITRTSSKTDTINPVLLSGGEECTVQDVKFDHAEKALTYTIDKPSRIMSRAGIKKGALFGTIVDMKPRLSGKVLEYWNGRDNDNLFDVVSRSQTSVAVFGYVLPQPCVLTYGNTKSDYLKYRKARGALVEKYFTIPHDSILGRTVTLHFRQPRVIDYAPRINVSFQQNEGSDSSGTLVLSGKTVVRTTIHPDDIDILNEQYEITFFIDNEFFTEEEVGYLPYNMVWDLSNLSKGNHILTVNISSFKDRIGVKSVKVLVK